MDKDLSTDLSILESHLGGMIDRVHHNDMMLKRFQVFEMKLLNLNSLSEMVEHVFDDAKALFDLDYINICLIDEKGEFAQFLLDDGYRLNNKTELIFLNSVELLNATFGFSIRPYMGRYRKSKCADFFPDAGKKPASVAIIPLHRRGRYLGSLNLGSHNPNRFVSNMATDFVEHMATVVSICLENNLNFESLKRTSLLDTLTGVNNRRFLEQRLGEEIYRSQRNVEPLTCLFLDIDFFKAINDTHGHQAGDMMLTKVAKTIKEQLRNNDILSRYGGEEFVALLSNIDETIGQVIAERIRQKIKSLSVDYKNKPIQVTISIGLSCYRPEEGCSTAHEHIANELIHQADTALYKAKNSGRDCIVSNGLIPLYAQSTKAG